MRYFETFPLEMGRGQMGKSTHAMGGRSKCTIGGGGQIFAILARTNSMTPARMISLALL